MREKVYFLKYISEFKAGRSKYDACSLGGPIEMRASTRASSQMSVDLSRAAERPYAPCGRLPARDARDSSHTLVGRRCTPPSGYALPFAAADAAKARLRRQASEMPDGEPSVIASSGARRECSPRARINARSFDARVEAGIALAGGIWRRCAREYATTSVSATTA